MFYRLPSNFINVERQLQINIFYNASAGIVSLFIPVNLPIKSTKTSNARATRLVYIRLGVKPAILHHIKDTISRLPNVDTLIFNLLIKSLPTYLSIFQQILDRLPTLRKVVLYMHESSKPLEKGSKQYSHVEQLELNVGGDMLQSNGFDDRSVFTFQDTFSRSISMFPRTKYLKLHYSSGFWKEEMNQFEIPLLDLHLKSLYLDVTPVLSKTYNHQVALEDSYFVMCVQTADRRHMYQVSFDYLGIAKIDNKTLPQDQTQVTINIASLNFIKLYLCKDILKNVDSKTYLQTSIENVLEAQLPII